MTTQDLVTIYKSERSEAKLGQQLFAIPHKDNIIDQQQLYYFVGDRRKVAVDFTKEICFHLKKLDLKPMTPEQYLTFQESTTPMEYLIEGNLIYPFMLFIRGHFIKWENITIIASQERYDLLIHDLDEEFFKIINPTGVIDADTEVFTVSLPDSIEYYQGGYDIDDHTLFAFNESGVLITSGNAYIRIQNYDTSVEVIDFNPVATATFTFTDDAKYKYFPENVFLFESGLYDGSADIQILSTSLMINNNVLDLSTGDPNRFCLRIFHNTKHVTPTFDIISKADQTAIQNDVYTTLQGGEVAPYMEKLKPSFDPPYSVENTSDENTESILSYVAQYDSILFNDLYRSNADFIDLEVDYAWVMAHLNDDGNLSIPRRFADGKDFYIILLVNGELYEYYRMHKYENSKFVCPVQNMVDGDVIELLYFKNCNNFMLNANVSQDEVYYRLDESVYNKDLRVFSKETQDTYFTFPSDSQTMFPVEYTLESDPTDGKATRIRFTDEFYYGKDLILASAYRFKYIAVDYDNIAGYEVDPGESTDNPYYFSIDLGENFLCCNEYDRYVVFFNGKRMINDLYRLILPYRTTTPFTKAMIYLCVPIEPGDRVEIFYLPHHFSDIISDSEDSIIDENGTITIDKSKLSYALDNQLCSVWINAKKIPPSKIVNVSSTKLQITTNLTSTNDVRVTTMISDDEVYAELKEKFSSLESNWDKVIELYADHFTLLNINKPTVENIDPAAFADVIPTVAIMNEIIRDWYQANPIVDTTGTFLYDYDDVDQSAIIGQDPMGNDLLGSADANESNNLNVNRPWP